MTNFKSFVLFLKLLSLFKWFQNSHVKANPGKSHILLSNKKREKVKINNVVGIILDPELKFEKHITDICNQTSSKLNVLPRIASYMSLNKRRFLMKTFLECYCSLIWMFHSRPLNNKTNNVNEKNTWNCLF